MVNPVRNTKALNEENKISNGVKKIILVLLCLVFTQNILFAAAPPPQKSEEPAVNFTLTDLENKDVSLSDFKERPIILFFWTTWCPFCREELRQLDAMHKELLRNGIGVLAINIQEPLEKVQKFIKGRTLSFKVLLDKDADTSRAYGIVGVPTYIFINKAGRIVFEGHYFPEKDYKDIILPNG